jgi:hypothetical protein
MPAGHTDASQSGTAKPVFFGLKIASDSIDAAAIVAVAGASSLGIAMGVGDDRLSVLFRLGGLLRAAGNARAGYVRLLAESPHRDDKVLSLLEENARLRKLAVKLSNIVGDLPPPPTAGDDGS